VKSDVKNAATQVESWITSQGGGNPAITQKALVDDKGVDIKVSSGVTLTVSGTANDYCITGFHSNGKDFIESKPAAYSNASGGFEDTCSASGEKVTFTAPTA
jgi:hypothetical protein